RVVITVFTPQYAFGTLQLSQLLVWLGVLAIFVGAFLALSQRNLRRMLTYIIVSEIGYMIGGIWLGNKTAMTGAILHLVNDTLMTFCVFLASVAIARKFQSLEIDDLKELFSKMPFTMAGLVAGALSIIGVPPTCGFFSKWYLISGAMEAGNYVFVVALLFSSLVSVILFFRVFEVSLFGHESHQHHGSHGAHKMEEASASIVLPLLIVAVGLVMLGISSGYIVNYVILPVISGSFM
ncbi:MAG TPA: monovalent cation/H+ antiporter subunit D family protein, partial [Desulfobacterales bacterium]|nr:monovalent cation/H+ antiporter subunit D family protein [Desulfobacterales bacterium]